MLKIFGVFTIFIFLISIVFSFNNSTLDIKKTISIHNNIFPLKASGINFAKNKLKNIFNNQNNSLSSDVTSNKNDQKLDENPTNNLQEKTFEINIEKYFNNLNYFEIRNDGAKRITNILSAQNPVFSSDHSKILFTYFPLGYNNNDEWSYSDLMIIDLYDNMTKTLLHDKTSNVNLPGSTWINNSIVYSSDKDPHDEIYIYNYNTKTTQKITTRQTYQAYEPSFSPDLKKIVFESHKIDQENYGQIYVYDLDTKEYTELTNKIDDSRQPNWGPDNKHIVYQKYEKNNWNLWVYDLHTKENYQLTNKLGDETDASFSPDGEYIVYSSDTEEEYASIYVINLKTKEDKKITFTNTYDGAPSFSPDGKYIAFESSKTYPDESKGTSIWIIPFTN